MKCCVSTGVGTWTNWLTFEPDPDYSPDAGTGLLSPISYKQLQRVILFYYVGKIPCIGRPSLQQRVVLNGFIHREPSEQLCRRYMRSTECPSSITCTFTFLQVVAVLSHIGLPSRTTVISVLFFYIFFEGIIFKLWRYFRYFILLYIYCVMKIMWGCETICYQLCLKQARVDVHFSAGRLVWVTSGSPISYVRRSDLVHSLFGV